MRLLIACLAAFGLLAGSVAVTAPIAAADSAYVAMADQQQPGGQLQVDIDVDDGEWWANPVWLAIGALALVMLIVIIVMAARGGGTTVIKE